jgi:hypothetical protein
VRGVCPLACSKNDNLTLTNGTRDIRLRVAVRGVQSVGSVQTKINICI